METVKLGDREFIPFICEDEIKKAIKKIACDISRQYKNSNPLFICVLKGAVFFAVDLLRLLDFSADMTFIRVASYCDLTSTGEVKMLQPLIEPVKNRQVIIVDDVMDSGCTYRALKRLLLSQGAESVSLAVLLYKPDASKCGGISPDFYGFKIGNEFVVGYGLDYNDMGRSLKDIFVIKD